jgi:hypothetical protein
MAAVATMLKHGQITPMIAAIRTVLASVASMLVNIRETRDGTLVRNLVFVSLAIARLGGSLGGRGWIEAALR